MDHKLIDFKPHGSKPSDKFNPPTPSEDIGPSQTFYTNPFYDKVFMLKFDMRLRTLQSKNRKNLKSYKDIVNQMVAEVETDERFPYKAGVMLVLQFVAPMSEIKRVDVDNLAKPIIDMMKRRLFVDDKQICMLWVDKSPWEWAGCKVGIKLIGPEGLPMMLPPLHVDESDMRQLLALEGLTLEQVIENGGHLP